jgi:hypothetical protein
VSGAELTAASEQRGLRLRARAREWRGALLGCVGLVLVSLPFLPRFGAPGSEMDEGALLSYAGRVQHGAIPWRDFQTFYGPGNVWLLGAVTKVFGVSVATERSVGLLYRLGIVLALFLITRRYGWVAAGAAVAVCALMLPGEGIAALALYGSLAFGLGGVALLALAVDRPVGRRRNVQLVAAGALFAAALLIRFDFVAAVVLPAVVLLPRVSWRERGRTLAGFAVLLAAYIPLLALVGPSKLARMVHQLLATEPGRRLPYPPPDKFPGNFLAASIAATVLLIVVGAVLSLRRRDDLDARILLAGGLFSLGVLPTTLSRTDHSHVIPGSVVSLALLASLVTVLVRGFRARRPGAIVPLCCYSVALALCVGSVAMLFGGGLVMLKPVLELDRLHSYDVLVDGRSFPLSNPSTAADVQSIVSTTDRLAKPGQSLFVGPLDLRLTNYNDAYIYYLLPKLEPASFYMEMNPQTANLPGSGLANDLRKADWLLLTLRYDLWLEPNSSTRRGSTEPGAVVRAHFCTRAIHGLYVLLQRCK